MTTGMRAQRRRTAALLCRAAPQQLNRRGWQHPHVRRLCASAATPHLAACVQKMMEAGIDIGARSHSDDHSSEGIDLKMESGDAGGDSPTGASAPDDRHDGMAPQLRLTHDEAVARLKQLVAEMRTILESHGLPSNHCLCAPHLLRRTSTARPRLHPTP